MNTGRSIMHLDLDTFFVSVERLLDSSLAGKPVIIGGTSNRGVVSTCSYEARKFGVHSAMPMVIARKLCPHAIYIKGNHKEYSKYSNLVTEIIASKAPLFEKASIDEHYIALTGMDRFFGTLKWAKELRSTIVKESGLPISFGLSVNKSIAKIATDESKPNGELEVKYSEVRSFIDPLSIKKLPMVGPKTFNILSYMGIHTVQNFINSSPEMINRLLGEHGNYLRKVALGEENSPVVSYHERKSISVETTFNEDTMNLEFINNKLVKMVEELCYTLRNDNKICGSIAVKIRYGNFETYTKQKAIELTASDHLIMPQVRQLFKDLHNSQAIRLIGVKLSNLSYGSQQIDMFNDTSDMLNLYQALDEIKNKFGKKPIKRAI
jgi:DNA polymerase-4